MRLDTAWRWWSLRALRPYLRNPLLDRGKWALLHRLNPKPGNDLDWKRFGCRVCRMRDGGLLYCDLRHAADRFVYFSGEYEIGSSRFLRQLLTPAWRFVDVGANVGKYMVLVASRVREVICVEPNPVSRWFLDTNVALNGFENVRIVPVALGEEDGHANLNQATEDLGGASLLEGPRGAFQYSVVVQRGDTLTEPDGLTYLKIDVEGFEERVVRGFEELLVRKQTVVQMEITDDWLRRAGGSTTSLFSLIRDWGYTPFRVDTQSRLRTTFKLTRLDAPSPEFQYNVVFLPKQSEAEFWKWVRDAGGASSARNAAT